MALPDIASADPVEALYDFLRGMGAEEAASILGGPALEHVTGELEPAWPHVVLSTGINGDLRGLIWDTEEEVVVEVYGSPAGIPGEADLRKIAVQVMQLLCDLPNRDTAPDQTVVTRVRPTGVWAYQDTPAGHSKWTLSLMVATHPPA